MKHFGLTRSTTIIRFYFHITEVALRKKKNNKYVLKKLEHFTIGDSGHMGVSKCFPIPILRIVKKKVATNRPPKS